MEEDDGFRAVRRRKSKVEEILFFNRTKNIFFFE